MARRGIRFASSVLLLSALAGCRDDLTQVVVVLQSDLVVPTDTDGIQVMVGPGPIAPSTFQPNVFFGSDLLSGNFPRSFGVTSGGSTSSFSANIQLMRGFSQGVPPLIVVNRSVTDVRFVEEQTMMVLVPLLRACACQGTACPSPGDPQCDAINQPALQPFDPEVAPPSMPNLNGGFNGGPPPARQGDPVLSVAVAGGSPS